MKTWIKTILREALDEMAPTKKCVYGAGCFHKVYSSNQNSNRLYKIGRKEIVKRWVPIFKAHPEYFPKVYRIFPSSKDPEYWIVEIEKLDANRGNMDYRLVSDLMYSAKKAYKDTHPNNFGIVGDYPTGLYRIETLFDDDISLSDYLSFMKSYFERDGKGDYQLYSICEKWITTMYNVYSLLNNSYNYDDNDIHEDNVAYDKDGNIKIIDI